MTKTSMVRLPDAAAEKVQQYATVHGLRFATAVRVLVINHLQETYPNLLCDATG